MRQAADALRSSNTNVELAVVARRLLECERSYDMLKTSLALMADTKDIRAAERVFREALRGAQTTSRSRAEVSGLYADWLAIVRKQNDDTLLAATLRDYFEICPDNEKQHIATELIVTLFLQKKYKAVVAMDEEIRTELTTARPYNRDAYKPETQRIIIASLLALGKQAEAEALAYDLPAYTFSYGRRMENNWLKSATGPRLEDQLWIVRLLEEAHQTNAALRKLAEIAAAIPATNQVDARVAMRLKTNWSLLGANSAAAQWALTRADDAAVQPILVEFYEKATNTAAALKAYRIMFASDRLAWWDINNCLLFMLRLAILEHDTNLVQLGIAHADKAIDGSYRAAADNAIDDRYRANAHATLAKRLSVAGWHDEAVQCARRGLELAERGTPAGADVAIDCARVLAVEGFPDDARRVLDGLKTTPGSHQALAAAAARNEPELAIAFTNAATARAIVAGAIGELEGKINASDVHSVRTSDQWQLVRLYAIAGETNKADQLRHTLLLKRWALFDVK